MDCIDWLHFFETWADYALPVALHDRPEVLVHLLNLVSVVRDLISRSISADRARSLKASLVEALCEYELIAPSSDLSIMFHLLLHLADTVIRCGPVSGYWMFSYERYNGWLKRLIHSRTKPEANLVNNYVKTKIRSNSQPTSTNAHPDSSFRLLIRASYDPNTALAANRLLKSFGYVPPEFDPISDPHDSEMEGPVVLNPVQMRRLRTERTLDKDFTYDHNTTVSLCRLGRRTLAAVNTDRDCSSYTISSIRTSSQTFLFRGVTWSTHAGVRYGPSVAPSYFCVSEKQIYRIVRLVQVVMGPPNAPHRYNDSPIQVVEVRKYNSKYVQLRGSRCPVLRFDPTRSSGAFVPLHQGLGQEVAVGALPDGMKQVIFKPAHKVII
jgi:hypothetical protein